MKRGNALEELVRSVGMGVLQRWAVWGGEKRILRVLASPPAVRDVVIQIGNGGALHGGRVVAESTERRTRCMTAIERRGVGETIGRRRRRRQ